MRFRWNHAGFGRPDVLRTADAGKGAFAANGGRARSMAGGDGFFQLCLLAGYILAHLASRWSPQRHVFVWLGLIAAAGLFLPPHIDLDVESSSHFLSWQVFKK